MPRASSVAYADDFKMYSFQRAMFKSNNSLRLNWFTFHLDYEELNKTWYCLAINTEKTSKCNEKSWSESNLFELDNNRDYELS